MYKQKINYVGFNWVFGKSRNAINNVLLLWSVLAIFDTDLIRYGIGYNGLQWYNIKAWRIAETAGKRRSEVFTDISQFYESDVEKKIYFDKDDSDLTWTSMAHYHRAIELCFPIRDPLVCCVNGENFTVEAGEIAFIDSFEVHYFEILMGSSRYAVVIGAEFLREFYEQYGKKNRRARFPRKLVDKEKNKLLIDIVSEWGTKNCNRLQNLGYVNLLLGTIAELYGVEYCDNENDNLVVKILSFINEHYKEQIDLELLAKTFGYSKSTVSRAISNAIGEDLRTYVNLIRARDAYKLLKSNPEMTVTEAASESGFNSPKTFYRAYRQVFNENPKIKKRDGKP